MHTTEESRARILPEWRKSADDAQRLVRLIQEYLAEAHSAEEVYIRGGGESEFQYSRWREMTMEAALCAERLTERLRRLMLGAQFPPEYQTVYQRQLVQSHGIQIEYEENVLRVELPILLSHRKNSHTDYIYKPLFLALLAWCEERMDKKERIPSYTKATLCYVHMYDKRLSVARIRDHDNMEQKQAADALGMFFLVSDSGLYMDTYHTTVLGDRDRTLLYLMPAGLFGRWIEGRRQGAEVSKIGASIE